MVKFNHSCLVDAHNFTEVCQCSIDKKENCDIFKKVKPMVHKNENDLEGIFEIGGMQFDQDFFYLPDFNDTFVKLDNECLKMVKNMKDICLCQTEKVQCSVRFL